MEGGGCAERHPQSRMSCPALCPCALCVCECVPDSTLESGIGAPCLARSPVTGPILRRDRRPSASFLAPHFIRSAFPSAQPLATLPWRSLWRRSGARDRLGIDTHTNCVF
jgi:hypothetical protein